MGIVMRGDSMKKMLDEHFEFLSKMSTDEYTLYRTWKQINTEKWDGKKLQRIWELGQSMWIPKKPEDYLKLDPVVEVVQSGDHDRQLTWKMLRYFVSSAPTFAIPGRSFRIIVSDRVTRTYLGVMQLASDFPALKTRDEFIGWTTHNKIKDRMLNYLAMGATIVPTQPLGFNYVGGKLMSLLLTSDAVIDEWNKKYKEPLLGITTTSLYGTFSQYNGLKYWRKCGKTGGKISLEPDNEVNLQLRHWVRDNYPEELKKMEQKSHPKIKVLNFCYKKFGIKPPVNNAPRGVYFCQLYDNIRPFLRKETDSFGNKKFDNSVQALTELWKTRYASKRLKNVLESDRYNTNISFYDDIIGMSWGDAKKKYLAGVKR